MWKVNTLKDSDQEPHETKHMHVHVHYWNPWL